MPHTCSYSFIYHFLLQKKPCLRWWNHSSMSLFWNAIVLTVGQAQSCKFRYLSCEKRETLRSTRQSTKQFDLPSLAESCEKREMLCSTMRCWSTRIHSSLEQQFFLKCCSSSGWIWTDQYSLIGLMVGVRHTGFPLWDELKLCMYQDFSVLL